jgi:hypothetical protein
MIEPKGDETVKDGGPAWEDFEDECPRCGGEGFLDDECECSAFEDTCCCAELTPRECPDCRKKSASPEMQAVLREALKQ